MRAYAVLSELGEAVIVPLSDRCRSVGVKGQIDGSRTVAELAELACLRLILTSR